MGKDGCVRVLGANNDLMSVCVMHAILYSFSYAQYFFLIIVTAFLREQLSNKCINLSFFHYYYVC